jgi:hypothetical protein
VVHESDASHDGLVLCGELIARHHVGMFFVDYQKHSANKI